MAEIVGISDGGIFREKGLQFGTMIIRIVRNEGTHEEIIGRCHPCFHKAAITGLRRLLAGTAQIDDTLQKNLSVFEVPDNE
jgi:hypothetical protein